MGDSQRGIYCRRVDADFGVAQKGERFIKRHLSQVLQTMSSGQPEKVHS